MGYLVHALDFDWMAPAKSPARRPGSRVSLVSRLGRCCSGPSSRKRASSSDWSGQDGGDGSSGNAGRGGSRSSSRRRASSSRERAQALNNIQSNGPGGQRRSFGLRRGDEEAGGGPSGAAGRIRIDGSPAPLPSVSAQTAGRQNGGGLAPDERFVEILCNDFLVDADMSLATVRDFLWRKSGQELVLTYRRPKRVITPTSPAPPPPLLSPGASNNAASPAAASPAAASPAASPAGVAATTSSDMSEDVTSELNGLDSNPSPGRSITSTLDGRDSGGPPRE